MIENLKGIDRIMNTVSERERKAKARNTLIVLMLRSAIARNLAQAIGEKSKHFTVTVQPSGRYMSVVLKPKDAVGSYIYRGTRSHYISSSEPMPIGNNRFARNVMHPGTDSEREKIDNAVRRSLMEVKMAMKVIR